MGHFIRKIRKDLIAQNKFRSYMLYAIGEIILVVAGILIALQINNWNNYKTKIDSANFFMEQIQADLATDTIHFMTYKIGLTDLISTFEACIEDEFNNDSIILSAARIIEVNTDPREFGEIYANFVISDSYPIYRDNEIMNIAEDYYRRKCRIYNIETESHKSFVFNNIQGHLIHKQLITKSGGYNSELLKKEINSGSFISLTYYQYQTLKRILIAVEDCDMKAKELILAIQNLKVSDPDKA